MKPSACGGSAPDHRTRRAQVTAMGVRRDKAALSSGCKPHPAIRSNTAPDKSWPNSSVPKDCPTSWRCWCWLAGDRRGDYRRGEPLLSRPGEQPPNRCWGNMLNTAKNLM